MLPETVLEQDPIGIRGWHVKGEYLVSLCYTRRLLLVKSGVGSKVKLIPVMSSQ